MWGEQIQKRSRKLSDGGNEEAWILMKKNREAVHILCERSEGAMEEYRRANSMEQRFIQVNNNIKGKRVNVAVHKIWETKANEVRNAKNT